MTPGGTSRKVEGVSTSEATNGDSNPPSVDPIDNTTILAAVKVCIAKSEEAAKAAGEARDLAADVKRATSRLASDHFELRTGIPPSWRRRLALAAVAAGIGAVTGGGVALVAFRMALGK